MSRRAPAAAAIAASTLLVLAACGGPRSTPASDPAEADAKAAAAAGEIAVHLGATPAATADAMVTVAEPGRDAEKFHVYLWCDADGAVRVEAQRLDIEFCSARLQADGQYVAWNPRAKLGARGDLDDEKDQGGLLAVLRQAATELTIGPVPQVRVKAGPGPETVLAPLANGMTAQLTLDRGARSVTAKRLLDADGTEVVRIAYERYRPSDELIRATVATLAFPDGGEAKVMVRKFEPLGGISDERMRLALPDGAAVVPLREFLARIGE